MGKRNRSKETLSLLGIGGLLGCLVGIAIGMGLLGCFYPIFQSENWAAWVQAIGSVLAIIASVLLVFWQMDYQLKQKRDLEFEEVKSITVNILKSVEHLDNFLDDFLEKRNIEGYQDKNNYEYAFKIWHEGLCEIKCFSSVVSDLYPTVIGLRHSTLYMVDVSRKYGNSEELSSESVESVLLIKGGFENSRIKIKEFIDKYDLGIQVSLKGFPQGVTVKDGTVYIGGH